MKDTWQLKLETALDINARLKKKAISWIMSHEWNDRETDQVMNLLDAYIQELDANAKAEVTQDKLNNQFLGYVTFASIIFSLTFLFLGHIPIEHAVIFGIVGWGLGVIFSQYTTKFFVIYTYDASSRWVNFTKGQERPFKHSINTITELVRTGKL